MAESKSIHRPVTPHTVKVNAYRPDTGENVLDFNVIGETDNYLFGNYAFDPDNTSLMHVHKTQVITDGD